MITPDNSVQPRNPMYADFMKAMGQNRLQTDHSNDGGDQHFMDDLLEYTTTAHAARRRLLVAGYGKPPGT